jgi:DNA polymerase-3 subunit chi
LNAVNFYVLNDTADRDLFACRLCQRALSEGLALFVWCESPEQLAQFDQLLWTFQATSFIPHETDDASAPICLSVEHPESLAAWAGRPVGCLNLNSSAVDPIGFERVIEIIAGSDSAKASGRERFKAYKQRGITPVTHQIK